MDNKQSDDTEFSVGIITVTTGSVLFRNKSLFVLRMVPR